MPEFSYFDAADLGTPGACNPIALRTQLTTAIPANLCTTVVLDSDPEATGRLATEGLVLGFTTALTGPEQTTADVVIAVHMSTDPTTDDLGDDVVNISIIDFDPPSNTWTDIPGASWDVDPARKLHGRLSLSATTGSGASASPRSAGSIISFDATRGSGDVSVSEAPGQTWGKVSRFAVRATEDGVNAIKIQLERKGSDVFGTLAITGTLTREILP